jgi:hypothetical protein
LVVRHANGVGSRFREKANHAGNTFSETTPDPVGLTSYSDKAQLE